MCFEVYLNFFNYSAERFLTGRHLPQFQDFWSSYAKGSRKKSPTPKRGIGVRARPLRKKELFFNIFLFVAVEKKVPNDH